MATIGTSLLTQLDWAKRIDPKGKAPMIAELLSQTNEILNDPIFKEGNLPTGDRITQRTGLPTVYWRLINKGVPTSKSTTAQVDEQVGNLQARSHVDEDMASLEGNLNEFRLNESMAFIESMNQEMAGTMIYGSPVNPEEFVGFANRYNDLAAANAQNILDAGGTGSDNSSVWLVGWGDNSVYSIFPKGSVAGLEHQDLGVDDVEDSDGNLYRAYKDLYKWKSGISLKDWRYVVRIANIDVSDLAGLTGTQELTDATLITKMMSRAIDRLPSLNGVTPVFYANRTVLSLLRIVAQEKSSSAVTIQEATNQFGQTIFETRFLNIPVRMVDQLTEAESQVT